MPDVTILAWKREVLRLRGVVYVAAVVRAGGENHPLRGRLAFLDVQEYGVRGWRWTVRDRFGIVVRADGFADTAPEAKDRAAAIARRMDLGADP